MFEEDRVISRNVGETPIPEIHSDTALAAEIDAYHQYLTALPSPELATLFDAEKEKEKTELLAEAQTMEEKRFFNQPSAEARLDYWSRMPSWALAEAVALSLNKDPSVVNPSLIKRSTESSPTLKKYADLLEIARRAANAGQLTEPCQPGVFLAWCKRNDIPYPLELATLVIARGNIIGDWKSAFDQLKADSDRRIDTLQESLTSATAELEQARTERNANPTAELSKRETDSLLKLVIGMAVKGYAYDPSAKRNDATKEIADDLAELGISLDVDTVRKWLGLATEILPRARDL